MVDTRISALTQANAAEVADMQFPGIVGAGGAGTNRRASTQQILNQLTGFTLLPTQPAVDYVSGNTYTIGASVFFTPTGGTRGTYIKYANNSATSAPDDTADWLLNGIWGLGAGIPYGYNSDTDLANTASTELRIDEANNQVAVHAIGRVIDNSNYSAILDLVDTAWQLYIRNERTRNNLIVLTVTSAALASSVYTFTCDPFTLPAGFLTNGDDVFFAPAPAGTPGPQGIQGIPGVSGGQAYTVSSGQPASNGQVRMAGGVFEAYENDRFGNPLGADFWDGVPSGSKIQMISEADSSQVQNVELTSNMVLASGNRYAATATTSGATIAAGVDVRVSLSEIGPQGDQGIQGNPGNDGTNGTNGTDGVSVGQPYAVNTGGVTGNGDIQFDTLTFTVRKDDRFGNDIGSSFWAGLITGSRIQLQSEASTSDIQTIQLSSDLVQAGDNYTASASTSGVTIANGVNVRVTVVPQGAEGQQGVPGIPGGGFSYQLQGCDLCTTGNVALTGEQTIDGTLTSGSRVLVPFQTAKAENGIYVTGAGAWTRATDLDAAGDFQPGLTVSVISGERWKNTGWVFQEAIVTLGTDDVNVLVQSNFEQSALQETLTGTKVLEVFDPYKLYLDGGALDRVLELQNIAQDGQRRRIVNRGTTNDIRIDETNGGTVLVTVSPNGNFVDIERDFGVWRSYGG